MSGTISRVMSLNDHLSRTYVAISLKRPTGKQIGSIYGFPTLARRLGLASDGVYTAPHVTTRTVVSYTAFSPLPSKMAVIFCCTGLGVTSTGRYPASCPMKPGLSSYTAFRHLYLRSPVLLKFAIAKQIQFITTCYFIQQYQYINNY